MTVVTSMAARFVWPRTHGGRNDGSIAAPVSRPAPSSAVAFGRLARVHRAIRQVVT